MTELNLRRQRILLVDDVFFARETIKKILFGLGNPEIIEASNGYKAMTEAQNSPSDITMVIADFNMPVMNGLQLLKSIRMDETVLRRDVPVAMLTGYSDQDLVTLALALDVNAFLVKPVSSATLAQRLQKLMDVGADTRWLKNKNVYKNVRVEIEDTRLGNVIPIAPEAQPPQEPAAPRTPSPATPPTPRPPARTSAGTTPSSREPRPERLKEKLSSKARAQDAAAKRENKSATDTTGQPAAKPGASGVVGQLSEMGEKYQNSETAKNITTGVQALVLDSGSDIAKRLVTALDALAKQKNLSRDDVAAVLCAKPAPRKGVAPDTPAGEEALTGLDDILEGAILARALHTVDGGLLLSEGTPLTPQIVGILQHLDELDLLLLEAMADDPGADAGLFVRYGEAPDLTEAATVAVHASDIPPGAILAQDIVLADGRQYMVSGATLTPRLISLLQDLVSLDRLKGKVWIVN